MSQLALRGQFSQFSNIGAGEMPPDPFMDLASLAIPTSLRSALYWSEYVYSLFGTYRMAMERVISYFLTDVEILNCSDNEREKWENFGETILDWLSLLQNMLRNRSCFHGDTKAITQNGVFKLRDLAGKTVFTLSADGVYRPAAFKSFGQQKLLEVEFSDGRTVLATSDHQWVAKNCSGKTVRVPTTILTNGYRIERTVAPRPEKNDEFYEGIRHGFVFGDGSRYNDGEQAAAYFYGPKDGAMLKYFEGHGCPPRKMAGRDAMIVNGLPTRYKDLPENWRSPNYWYGFVCGFLAADGTVDTYGCAMLTQKAKATLEVIAEQLPRIGMVGGPIRMQHRTTDLRKWSGPDAVYESDIHFLALLKRFMQPDDFLLPKHRANFVENYKPTAYGQYVGVKAVRETGIIDEVFCCVEADTHTFVIENGVLTANCYGNSFASVLRPFKRFLSCPKCGYMTTLKEAHDHAVFSYEWVEPDFHATCPSCKVGSGYRGPWRVRDMDDDDEKKIKVKIWNPHEIELLHDPYSDSVDYIWRIPEDYKRLVRQGHIFHLERAPKEVMKAIHYNQVYRFHPDAIYHMKEPTLAGIYNRGWGLPRILMNFRQIWYVQVLRRFNEAIALDYVVPFRIITPAAPGGKTGGGVVTDPLQMYNGTDFKGQVMQMIRRRRRDPAAIQVMPLPVQFQMFGADANQLAPRDLLDQGMETLLNDAGTPVELYNGSLQLQTAPVALRLFESTWHHLVHDANGFLRWLVQQISQTMSWEVVEAKLKRVTIADNLEKQMMAAQLFMSQQLSGGTVLGDMGYNWRKEQRQIADESRYQSELQSRTQEEMQQAGFAQQLAKGQGGGGAPGGDPSQGGGGGQPAPAGQGGAPGGDPSQGAAPQGPVSQYLASMGPNTPVTPNDMLQVASSIAQELMGMPEGAKDSELRKLKIANEALHSMVRAKMDQIRRDTRSKAGNQALGQAQQGGGQQAPPGAG